jgi:hypothetical protein
VLTPAERAVGRWWRDQQQAALDALNAVCPPDESRRPFVRHIRHLCPAGKHRSISFDYAELYLPSPQMSVLVKQAHSPAEAGISLGDPGDTDGERVEIPAGRFAFIYHEGRCAGCKRTARSKTGRVVDGLTRKPAGKVVTSIV